MVSEWKRNNKDKLKEQQKRYREKHKARIVIKRKEDYKKSFERNPNLNKDKYNKTDKVKTKARRKAKSIKIEGLCQRCGINQAQERHHPDYNYPNWIQLLCSKCHHEIHPNGRKELNRKGLCKWCGLPIEEHNYHKECPYNNKKYEEVGGMK